MRIIIATISIFSILLNTGYANAISLKNSNPDNHKEKDKKENEYYDTSTYYSPEENPSNPGESPSKPPQESSSKIMGMNTSTFVIGGLAVVGGGVAAALGGGGSGGGGSSSSGAGDSQSDSSSSSSSSGSSSSGTSSSGTGIIHPEDNDISGFNTSEAASNANLSDDNAGVNSYAAYSRGYDGRIFNRDSDGFALDTNSDGNVIVGVIDTGIDLDHPDLQNNILSDLSVTCTRSSGCQSGGEDIEDHGTIVAGIIAAEKNDIGMHGIAYNSKLISAAAIGGVTNGSDVAAIDHLTNNSAQVINASYGLGDPEIPIISANQGSGGSAFSQFQLRSFLTSAEDGKTALNEYQQMVDNGTIIVYAAGNSSMDQVGVLAGLPYYFDGNTNTVNREGYDWSNNWVAAISLDNDKTISNFSNECGVAANWCIGAQGRNVFTTDNPDFEGGSNYTSAIGTSISAPTISGAIAIVLGAFPHLPPETVLQIIFDTAEDLGQEGVDEIYGHGLVDLDAATSPSDGGWTLSTGSTTSSFSFQNSTMSLNGAMSNASFDGSRPVMFLDKYGRNFYVELSSLIKTEKFSKNLYQTYSDFAIQSNIIESKINRNLSFHISDFTPAI